MGYCDPEVFVFFSPVLSAEFQSNTEAGEIIHERSANVDGYLVN